MILCSFRKRNDSFTRLQKIAMTPKLVILNDSTLSAKLTLNVTELESKLENASAFFFSFLFKKFLVKAILGSFFVCRQVLQTAVIVRAKIVVVVKVSVGEARYLPFYLMNPSLTSFSLLITETVSSSLPLICFYCLFCESVFYHLHHSCAWHHFSFIFFSNIFFLKKIIL